MNSIKLKAPDISCQHCVAAIKNSVGKLNGVSTVEADADSKLVSITFDPSLISQSQIESTLAEEGYPTIMA